MNRASFVSQCGLALLSYLLLCIFAVGQDASTVAIRGTISDASGARIVGARVSVVSTVTGVARQTYTDNAGGFTLEMLPPGEYWVRAEARGMGK
jgi:hypothetical protein